MGEEKSGRLYFVDFGFSASLRPSPRKLKETVASALPPLAYFPALSLIGFGLGSAGTATVAIVMHISPAGARGTAMALRQMASRIGLFAMPFAAGAAALVAGFPGIFGLIALSSTTAGGLAHCSWRSTPPKKPTGPTHRPQ